MSSAAPRRIADWKETTDTAVARIANDNLPPGRDRKLAADWRHTIRNAHAARREQRLDQSEELLEAAQTTADRDLREASTLPNRQAARERKAGTCMALAAVKLERLDLAAADQLYREAIHIFAEDAARDCWPLAREGASALRRVASQLGRVDAARMAVALLHEAGAVLAEQADAQNELGLAHVMLGELTSSTEEFERARCAYDLALKAADTLPPAQALAFRLRVQTNQAVVLWNLGRLTDDTPRREQLFAEAATMLRTTIRAMPEGPGPGRIDWPRAMDNLGLVLLDQDKIVEAIAAFESARDAWADPNERARTLNNLGTAYTKAGRFEDALNAYDQALLLQPEATHPLAWGYTKHNRGLALFEKAQIEYVDKHTPQKGYELFEQARTELTAAREKRRLDWAPTLWASTTFALGDVYQQIAKAENNAQTMRHARDLYNQAIPYLSKSEQELTIFRLVGINLFINQTMIEFIMPSDKNIFKDFEALLSAHGVPRSDWGKTLVEMAAHWGGKELVAPVASGDATEASATPALQLPAKAPKLYAQRPKGQNIIDFLRDPEGWGPYVKACVLSRPDLNRLDPQAYNALAKWLHFNKTLPPDLRVPSKSETLSPEFETPEAVRAAARVAKRAYRQRIANL